MRFADKRLAVSGAASGIGAAIARGAHAEGATVVAIDVNAAGLERLGAELGERFQARPTDLLDVAAVEALAGDLGELDVLVNNAGISDSFTGLADTGDELWDRVLG